FSTEENKKGAVVPGQLADLAVLSADYFSIPEEEIKNLESVLTIVGGKVVHATQEFAKLAPPAPPASPDWSPVKHYGGYAPQKTAKAPGSKAGMMSSLCDHVHAFGEQSRHWVLGESGLWSLGCDCFAF